MTDRLLCQTTTALINEKSSYFVTNNESSEPKEDIGV